MIDLRQILSNFLMELIFRAIVGLFVLWHIIKYGEVGFFHWKSPPSILDPSGGERPTYQKGNLRKWFKEATVRWRGQVELDRQQELERQRHTKQDN